MKRLGKKKLAKKAREDLFVKKVNILASETMEQEQMVRDIIKSAPKDAFKNLYKVIKETGQLGLIRAFKHRTSTFKVPKKYKKELSKFWVPGVKKGEIPFGGIMSEKMKRKDLGVWSRAKEWTARIPFGESTLKQKLFEVAFWTKGTLAYEIRQGYQKEFKKTSRYKVYKNAGISFGAKDKMKKLVLRHLNFMLNVQGKYEYVEVWADTVEFRVDDFGNEYVVDRITERVVEMTPEIMERLKEYLGI